MPGLWLGAESGSASVTTAEKRLHPFREPSHRPSPPPSSSSSPLPWIVAAIALITLLAFLAGSAFNKRRGSSLDAPQNALPQAGLDDRSVGTSPEGVVRGPDISQLSPQERADRLFNRVMVLAGEGKTDSVLFFARWQSKRIACLPR